jgi:hypothetical protein
LSSITSKESSDSKSYPGPGGAVYVPEDSAKSRRRNAVNDIVRNTEYSKAFAENLYDEALEKQKADKRRLLGLPKEDPKSGPMGLKRSHIEKLFRESQLKDGSKKPEKKPEKKAKKKGKYDPAAAKAHAKSSRAFGRDPGGPR